MDAEKQFAEFQALSEEMASYDITPERHKEVTARRNEVRAKMNEAHGVLLEIDEAEEVAPAAEETVAPSSLELGEDNFIIEGMGKEEIGQRKRDISERAQAIGRELAYDDGSNPLRIKKLEQEREQ